ncbi:hypothetical protein QTP88_021320 [Uroleucon formosanum]
MTIFYSGSGNGRHEHGVGFIVKESLVKLVKKFEAVDDRLCYIIIEGKTSNIAIINCYAPTETAINDDKDFFYDNLERVYDMIPRSYIRILVGDQNAQVGREHAFRHTIGKEKQNLEETWNIVKDSINKSAEVFKKENTFNGKNSWFNERCKEAIERRAEARLKMIQDPSPDNIEEFVKNKKAASKILRQEKRQAEKGLIQKIEEHRLNPRLFFKKCRSIKEGFKA